MKLPRHKEFYGIYSGGLEFISVDHVVLCTIYRTASAARAYRGRINPSLPQTLRSVRHRGPRGDKTSSVDHCWHISWRLFSASSTEVLRRLRVLGVRSTNQPNSWRNWQWEVNRRSLAHLHWFDYMAVKIEIGCKSWRTQRTHREKPKEAFEIPHHQVAHG